MLQYLSKDDGQIKMTQVQYFSIAICFLMSVLDGMDVLVVSYCAPREILQMILQSSNYTKF